MGEEMSFGDGCFEDRSSIYIEADLLREVNRLESENPEMATMIERLLEKGSRWHPCDPLVVEARALLARINWDEK